MADLFAKYLLRYFYLHDVKVLILLIYNGGAVSFQFLNLPF